MWTLYALGLNPQAFVDTGAAIIQNLADEPKNFPKMIWPTNYSKLACQVAFTLFFAGSDYAPNAIIDNKNIDEYLQDHLLNAMLYFYRRIANETTLFNTSVFAVETLNEPNPGLVGLQDITKLPDSLKLRKGPTPTAFQAMLLGSGTPCEVEVYEFSTLGPKKTGTTIIDPKGKSAWIKDNSYDLKYGFNRDPGWELGRCIWAQNGVWDDTTKTVLIKDYFGHNPTTGEPFGETSFVNTYWTQYWSKFYMGMRELKKDLFLLAQPCTLAIPPVLRDSPFMDRRIIFAPHYYDGLTLVQKHWSNLWNVDVLGVLRGRYSTPAFAIKVGRTAIRNCIRDQLIAMKKEGIDNFGNVPCLMSETGMPFDLDDRKAYKSGDFSSQRDALDALGFALEGALLHHTLWTYCAKNSHTFGDHWNGEDFSIFCQKDWTKEEMRFGEAPDELEETNYSEIGMGEASGESSEASSSQLHRSNESSHSISSSIPSDTSETTLMGKNKNRVDTNKILVTEMSSWGGPSKKWANENTYDGNDVNNGMKRALAAIARPYPVAVKGIVREFGYDLTSFTFKLVLKADHCLNSVPVNEPNSMSSSTLSTSSSEPKVGTEVVIPEFCFPETSFEVSHTSGDWIFDSKSRILTWWHADGEQSIEIVSKDPPGFVFGTQSNALQSGFGSLLSSVSGCWGIC